MDLPTLDHKKLIGQAAEKLKVLISEDDPVFAVVVLNELVLSQFVEAAKKDLLSLVAEIDELKVSIPAAVEAAAGKLQGEAINLEAATKLISDKINEQLELIDIHAKQAAISAAESVTHDIKLSVQESIKQVAQEVLTAELLEAKGKVSAELNRLQGLTGNTIKQLNQVKEDLVKDRFSNMIYCMIASFLGFGLFFIFQKLVLQ